MNAKKPADESNFEKSLDRLEEIVNQMESGQLSLDDMMTRFEEGSRLVKQCSTKLREVEKKIEKLVSLQDADKTEPLETDGEK